MKMLKKRLLRSAFSLVELLVVIAIIAILMALIFPSLKTAAMSARSLKCMSNLRQLWMAEQSYANDYNDEYAGFYLGSGLPLRTWGARLMPYLGMEPDNQSNEGVFVCPELRLQPGWQPTSIWRGYFCNSSMSDLITVQGAWQRKRSRVTTPALTFLIGDGSPANTDTMSATGGGGKVPPEFRHLGGANFVFVDGHVENRKPDKATVAEPHFWTL